MERDELMPADERFARWFREHHDRVRRLSEKVLRDPAAAEDVAQETLLRAWERRDRIRDEDVGAWLTVVARNLSVSYARRGWRVVPIEPTHDRPELTEDPAVAVERNETRRAVRRALGGVSRRHRRVIYLREVEGIEYQELGSEFGLTPEGVRSVAFRARNVLRERLAAVGEGLSAFLLGVRLGGRRVRLRITTRVSDQPSAYPVMQTAMNAVLAFGIVFAGTGATAPAAAAPASLRAGGPAFAKPAAAVAAPDRSHSKPVPAAGHDIEAPADTPRGGGIIPRAGVKPFDVEDKKSEITLHIAGNDTGLIIEGMDGDGLDPAYWAIDAVFGPLCEQAPRVCEILRGEFEG